MRKEANAVKYKILTVVIAVIFILGVVGSVIVLRSSPTEKVSIISDGEVVRTVDLSTAADTSFDISYHGHVNTVEIKDHRIRVSSADCPDHTCVDMGWLHSSAMPIVCLPHHLVIEYSPDDDSPTASDVDAVTR